MTSPDELPAESVPVVTMNGVCVGHVYPAPGGDHAHWGTVSPHGYRSPFLHASSRSAVEDLLERAGVADGCHIDAGLTGELARLGERYGPAGVALAAAYLADPAVVVDRLTAGRASGAAPTPTDAETRP